MTVVLVKMMKSYDIALHRYIPLEYMYKKSKISLFRVLKRS